MQFRFTDEQLMIRDAVAGLAERHTPAAGGEAGGELWADLAQAGFLGALVPARLGGSELGLVEMGCILEGLGAALARGPYLGTALAGGRFCADLPDSPEAVALAGQMIDGRARLIPLLAFDDPAATTVRSGERTLVHGRFAPVLHGDEATHFLVPVDRNGTISVLCLPRGAEGVTVSSLPSIDPSRSLAAVVLDAVDADTAVAVASASAGTLAGLEAAAAVGSAADALGGAARILEIACGYAVERQQFGQPIAKFQALKHMLADGRVALDGLRSIVYAALWGLDHAPRQGMIDAAAAKALAGTVYSRLCGDAIQIYGAMGFAAETLPHLYLKRAQLDRRLFGTASHHYERFCELSVFVR